MQGMSELMEHGDDVGKADQGRFAFGWLGQVGDVVHHRGVSQEPRLADEFRHPGSAILVVALEVIAVEKCEVLAVGVEDFEDPYIGLVNGNVVALFESNSVELIGRVVDAVLQHVVDFEIGFYLSMIDVVASLANLLSVEVPIVGLDLEAPLLNLDDGLDVFSLASGLGSCGGNDGIHELQCGFGFLSHLVLKLPRGETRKAEEFGFLCAELGEMGDGVASVVGVGALGAVPGTVEDGLTRRAIAEGNKVGLLGGGLEWDYQAFDL